MVNLNTRQQKIVKMLLVQNHTNAEEIADKVNASKKTIYSDLKAIIPYLSVFNIKASVRPRIGIILEGSDRNRQSVLATLSNQNRENPVPSNNEERTFFMLMRLLEVNDYITIQNFADQLFISTKTIHKNLNSVAEILEKNNILLIRQAGKGVKVDINEGQRRKMIFKLINDSFGSNWLLKQNDQGLREEFHLGDSNNKAILSQEVVSRLIQLINEFSQQEHFLFSDFSFQSIVIHLAIAIERVRSGNFIESFQKMDESLSEERPVAMRLANLVENAFFIKFPPQEIYYLQLHLIAAIRPYSQLSSKVNEEQIDFLKKNLDNMNYDSELIIGLAIHMTSTVKRLRLRLSITNPFTDQIKQNFLQAFDDALMLKKRYENYYHIQINDDETAYMALHFEAFYERTREVKNKIKVIVVCSTGLGSSRLLAAKIQKEFPMLEIESVMSAKELMSNTPKEIDLIISTINLDLSSIPTIVVSPLLSKDDALQIERIVSNQGLHETSGKLEFQKLISKANLITALETDDWKESIYEAGQALIDGGYAKPGLVESAIEREKLSFTSFANIATPHGNPDLIIKPAILIQTLTHSIKWGSQEVNIIFFIALNQSIKKEQLDLLYSYFWDLIEDHTMIQEIENSSSSAELYELLLGVDNQ